jgi:quercetin dioxygenase-like cupin family protein
MANAFRGAGTDEAIGRLGKNIGKKLSAGKGSMHEDCTCPYPYVQRKRGRTSMKVKHSQDVNVELVEGAPGVTVRWLWSKADDAPTFALRLFEVKPGASTPYHSHAHEHEVYVLSGQGLLRGKSQEHALQAGSIVLVMPYDEHQFVNTGADSLSFLCGIPLPQ